MSAGPTSSSSSSPSCSSSWQGSFSLTWFLINDFWNGYSTSSLFGTQRSALIFPNKLFFSTRSTSFWTLAFTSLSHLLSCISFWHSLVINTSITSKFCDIFVVFDFQIFKWQEIALPFERNGIILWGFQVLDSGYMHCTWNIDRILKIYAPNLCYRPWETQAITFQSMRQNGAVRFIINNMRHLCWVFSWWAGMFVSFCPLHISCTIGPNS